MAQTLTDEFFCRYSPPCQLHSDQGKQFELELITKTCKLLGIAKSHTTPYHPQGDGLVERFNRTLLTMLSTAAETHPFDWERQQRPLCMAYNSSVHLTTGYSPFFLMFGRQAHMPVDLMYGPPPSGTTPLASQFANDLRSRLEDAYQNVREKMGHMLDRQKAYYDRKAHGAPYKEGDLVWLHSTVVARGRARKLHRPWTGPYRVLRKLSDVNYRIQDVQAPRCRPVVHFDRLKYCPPDIRLPHLQTRSE